jgi:hypothetical protein
MAFMNTKGQADDQDDQQIAAMKTWQRSVGLGGAAFHALAILRGVTYAGKHKLGLREAISVALDQGAAFKTWSEKGTPIRRVQVWAEGRPVMTVEPDKLSNLKSFHFNVPSPQDAVIQIVKADEGEPPVILRNVPLRVVPSCGVDETTPLPNGQRIRLKIVPEDIGRFDIMVAFAPGKEGSVLEASNRPREKRAAASAGGTKETSNHHREYLPRLLPQPAVNYGAWACAIVFFLGGLGYGFNGVDALMKRSPKHITVVLGEDARVQGAAQTSLMENDPSDKAAVPASLPPQTYWVTIKAGPKASDTSGSALTVEGNPACPTSFKPASAIEQPASYAWPKTKSLVVQEGKPESREVARVQNSPAEEGSEAEVVTPWDSHSQTKLASIESVDVNIDATSPSDGSELQMLRTSFVRVLKESFRWEVRERTEQASPDAVIKLRFEPDQTCLGVILVEIRDVEGKLLWQAHVGCRTLPKRNHEAMFADASARLLSKLPDKLKTSQNFGGPTPQNEFQGDSFSSSKAR